MSSVKYCASVCEQCRERAWKETFKVTCMSDFEFLKTVFTQASVNFQIEPGDSQYTREQQTLVSGYIPLPLAYSHRDVDLADHKHWVRLI